MDNVLKHLDLPDELISYIQSFLPMTISEYLEREEVHVCCEKVYYPWEKAFERGKTVRGTTPIHHYLENRRMVVKVSLRFKENRKKAQYVWLWRDNLDYPTDEEVIQAVANMLHTDDHFVEIFCNRMLKALAKQGTDIRTLKYLDYQRPGDIYEHGILRV